MLKQEGLKEVKQEKGRQGICFTLNESADAGIVAVIFKALF